MTFKNQKLVFLLAVAVLFVGCSDKRGFKAKIFKTPQVLNNKPTPETQGETPKGPSVSQEEIEAKQEEVNKNYEESSKGKVTIEYNEVGEEKKLDESASKDLTKDIQSLAQITAALPADQKLLKGLSLDVDTSKEIDGTSVIELRGLVSVASKDQAFVAGMTLKKGQRVVTNNISYTPSKDLDLNISVVADCSKEAEGKCVQFTIGVVVQAKDKADQGYLMHFDRQDSKFVLGLGGEALTTFEAAQAGEVSGQQMADGQQSDSQSATSEEQARVELPPIDSRANFRASEIEAQKKLEQYDAEKAAVQKTQEEQVLKQNQQKLVRQEELSAIKDQQLQQAKTASASASKREQLQDKTAARQIKATQSGAQAEKQARLTKEEAASANKQTQIQNRIQTSHGPAVTSYRQAEEKSLQDMKQLELEKAWKKAQERKVALEKLKSQRTEKN